MALVWSHTQGLDVVAARDTYLASFGNASYTSLPRLQSISTAVTETITARGPAPSQSATAGRAKP